jgi:hypothetical protein
MKMNDYKREWDNENRTWVYEHRVVIERQLGRKLSKDEHIHHIDGNPKNNSIKNLQLTNVKSHCRIHKPALKNKSCTIDGCNNVHHAKGYCKKHYAKIFQNGRKA